MRLRFRLTIRLLLVVVAIASCAMAAVVHSRRLRAEKRRSDEIQIHGYWIGHWEYCLRHDTDDRPELIEGYKAALAWEQALVKGIRQGTIDASSLKTKYDRVPPDNDFILTEWGKIYNRKVAEKVARDRLRGSNR